MNRDGGATETDMLEILLGVYREQGVLAVGPEGPGDDAAVVEIPSGRLVVTVDTLTEDQDFRRHWGSGYVTSGYDVGWKSAAQNLSDVNAMSATPTGCLTSITLPEDLGEEWLRSFAFGFAEAIQQLGARSVRVVGGDLGRGREVSVTTTAFGVVDGQRSILRSGARDGDVVAVCGNLGHAAAGLALLESDEQSLVSPEETWDAAVRNAVVLQLRPRPPLMVEGRERATAMMDISDGLLKDAGRLARASGLTIELRPDLDKLEPELASVARAMGADVRQWIYGGGEGHALLATFRSKDDIVEPWRVIGRAVDGEAAVVIFDGQGGLLSVDDFLESPDGWDPFVEGR